MKAALSRFNAGDFRQRHAGTFGFIQVNGKPKLVYVNSVDSDSASFSDSDGFRYSAKADGGFEFDFIPVERKWHNTPEGAILSLRYAARQWRRGICPDNTQLYEISHGRYTAVEVNFHTISKIYETAALTIKEIQDRYNSSFSVALNHAFAVDSKNKVYLFDRVIGTRVKPNEVRLTMPIVTQELLDCFRDIGLNVAVTGE